MVGKTNIGSGSSLSFKGALICITALAGSTITLIKNNLIIKTLYPKDQHILFNGMANWYYSISPSNYGEWTVTATLGVDGVSKTDSASLLINSNMQYAIKLFNPVIYFNNGDQNTVLTGGWTSSNYSYFGHGSKNGNSTTGQVLSVRSVSGSSSNTYGILGTENGIILGDVDAIDVLATIENYQSASRYYVILTTTKSITDSNHVIDIEFTNSGLKTINVSNLAKDSPYYISIASYVTESIAMYTSIFSISSIIGQRL